MDYQQQAGKIILNFLCIQVFFSLFMNFFLKNKVRNYKMRQSFKTVQCFWQWCIGIYAGTILPEVQMEGGEEGYMLYYSLTEKKNQSILINNIQNSQEDLNWIHLRCHQGSNPHWPTSWLGRALFSSITSKIGVDLITFTVHHSSLMERGQLFSLANWTISALLQ